VTTYNDTGLTPGTEYTYRVITTDGHQLVHDDFNGSVIDVSTWTVSDPGNVSQSGGQLTIASTIGAGSFVLAGINNSEVFDFTGATVSVKVVQPTDSRPEVYSAICSLNAVNAPPGDWAIAEFTIQNGQIFGDWQTLADYFQSTTETLDASHAYLRIRESAGSIIWEKSADGTTWVEMWNVPTPFDISQMQVFHYVGSQPDAAPTPTQLIIDEAYIDIAATIDATPSNEASATSFVNGYMTIRQAIIEKVQTVSKINSVYGHGTPPAGAFPFATVEAISNDSVFEDSANNFRVYKFRVRVHYSRTRDDQSAVDLLENAEEAVLRVLDDLLSAFDYDYTLGGIVQKVDALESSLGYQELTNGPARVGEIIIKCSLLVKVVS